MELVDLKKLILILILALTTVSCELFSPSRWDRVRRENEERGRECYETRSGYVYCKDKYGNYD